ncbi:hypothetical protein [Streptomyces sp. st77]|uniref:hypothetical protein n=1 Tax=Streptomyces sp. st77 TaxID=1828074 RepID=UPI000BFC23E4|nr:hypothetical protein [Streptomyces sp. st77]
MIVQIYPVAAFVFVVALVVGAVVFKYTSASHGGPPARGDLVGAIGAATGVGTLLWLFLTFAPSPTSASQPQVPTISSTADPAVR